MRPVNLKLQEINTIYKKIKSKFININSDLRDINSETLRKLQFQAKKSELRGIYSDLQLQNVKILIKESKLRDVES